MKESKKLIFIEQLLCARHCMMLPSRSEEGLFTKIPALGKSDIIEDKVFALNDLEGKVKANKREHDITSQSLFLFKRQTFYKRCTDLPRLMMGLCLNKPIVS